MGERSRARAEGTGKASKTKGPVHKNTCKIVGTTQRSEADCVPWGASPPKADILHLLCILPTILQVFSCTGLLVLEALPVPSARARLRFPTHGRPTTKNDEQKSKMTKT